MGIALITELTIPNEILMKIKNAWIAGVMSGITTLMLAIFASAGIRIFDFSVWHLLDAALILGLTFGIYKKSRICAIVMFVYFIISKIILAVSYDKPTGIIGFIFIYFFLMGIVGIVQYQRFMRVHNAGVLSRV